LEDYSFYAAIIVSYVTKESTIDAFWNDAPFTGIWEDTLEIPDDLDSFHLCVQDGYTGQTVDCLEMDGSIFSDFLSLYNLLSELLAYGPEDF
jgi:hypothetical protein